MRQALAPVIVLAAMSLGQSDLRLIPQVQAQSLESQIVGVWKLKTYVRKDVASGKTTPAFGTNPSGTIILTKGGHMSVIGIADGRKAPADAKIADAERVELHKSMFAYASTYKLDGSAIAYTVTDTWNQAWTGQTHKRKVTVVGNTLTLETAPFKSGSDGNEIVVTVAFERVE